MIKSVFIFFVFTNLIILITTSCTLHASISSLAGQVDNGHVEETVLLLEPYNIRNTNISYDSVTITWDSPNDSILSYKISVIAGSETPASCENENVLSISGTTFTLTGLSPNLSYSYRLCSVSPEESKQ